MRFKDLLIILLISFLVSFNLFRQEFYKSSDGELHLARISAYTKALKASHFPVRWAKNLNFSYGYPIFNFVYPLPYLISSVFNIMGLNIFNSLKLVFFLSFLFSGIGMYLWLEKKFGVLAGLLAACLYILAPYRLVDVYVRAALGEVFAFIFPPFILYFWEKFNKKASRQNLFLTALFYNFLVLSHNVLAVIFSVFFGFYVLFFKNRKISYFKNFLPFITGLLFSCFFWLPALVESKYTMVRSPLFGKDYHENFLDFKDLIVPSWGYGVHGTSYQIGIVLLFIFLVFVIRLGKTKDKRLSFFIMLMFFLSIFFMLPYSDFLWRNIQILKDFQIPTRFLSLTIFIICIMAGLVVSTFNRHQKLLLWFLILLALFLALTYAKPEKYLNLGKDFYKNYSKSTTWHQEATPVWVGSEADSFPEGPFGSPDKVTFLEFEKEYTHHYLKVKADEESLVIDNTLYFPGWKVHIDGQKVPIQFQDPRFRGLITFKVPAGVHEVEVFFGRSAIRLIAELISLISFLTVIFFLFLSKIELRRK